MLGLSRLGSSGPWSRGQIYVEFPLPFNRMYYVLFNSEPINYHIFISIFTSYSVLIWLCKTWQSGYRLLQCGRGPGLHRCSVWSLRPRPVLWCTGCSRHSLSHLRNITCCSFQKRLDIYTLCVLRRQVPVDNRKFSPATVFIEYLKISQTKF